MVQSQQFEFNPTSNAFLILRHPFCISFFASPHDSGFGDRYNSAQKKKVAAATFENQLWDSWTLQRRLTDLSLLSPPRPQCDGDVPWTPRWRKEKVAWLKRDAMWLGERPFCKRTRNTVENKFPSVRYKQIHKTTTWPAFTSTDNHKDHFPHYDSVPTSVAGAPETIKQKQPLASTGGLGRLRPPEQEVNRR